MGYADPQSMVIPVIGTVSLPRTSSGTQSGAFTSNDGSIKLEVSHSSGRNKRNRRTIRATYRKVAADPLLTGVNREYSMSAYVVVDTESPGFTVAEAKQIVDGLTAYLTASSGANVTKLLGGEV